MAAPKPLIPQDYQFYYDAAKHARSEGHKDIADAWEKRAIRLDVAWGLVKLFELITGRKAGGPKVVVPHPGENRHRRRLIKAKTRNWRPDGK